MPWSANGSNSSSPVNTYSSMGGSQDQNREWELGLGKSRVEVAQMKKKYRKRVTQLEQYAVFAHIYSFLIFPQIEHKKFAYLSYFSFLCIMQW